MANTDFIETLEFTYSLHFHENIELPDKKVPELTLEQRAPTSLNYSNQSFDIELNGVEFLRNIYQPGCITANLHFFYQSKDTVMLSQDDLKTILLQRRISLGITPKDADSSEIIIAENYYVHEIVPQVIKDSMKSMLFVKLCMYSMDKLMTLNPYSKAYVTKRLGADILTSESKIFGFKSQLVKVDTKNMQSLVYQNAAQPGTTNEFIQPYLVQYNESFYDFMVRVANRCGEFLMFEDGQLILGLPKKTEPKLIKDYVSVSYQNMSTAPLNIKAFARDSVKSDKRGEFNDSPVEKDATGYPQGIFGTDYTTNSELAHDDYIFPMFKDGFSSFGKVIGMYDATSAIRKLSLDLFAQIVSNHDDAWEGPKSIAKNLGMAYTMSLLTAKGAAASANKGGNEKWIDAYKDKPQQSDGTMTVPFATALKEGWVKLAFYSQIRKDEEEQQKKIMHIDMGVNTIPVKLGDLVTIDKMDGKFIVIRVQLQSDISKKTGTTPVNTATKILQSQQIDVIPVIEEGENKYRALPPVIEEPVVRKSGPQTAFIVDSNDPKKQGRVRIAFPWQAVGDPQQKQELEMAKADLKQKQDIADEAKAKQAQLAGLLAVLNAQTKALATLQAELEKERDVNKQMKLFKEKREDNLDKQEENARRVKEITADLTNENSPYSIAYKLKELDEQMKMHWYDYLTPAKSLGSMGVLKIRELTLQNEKARLEEERNNLKAENDFLKKMTEDLNGFEASGAASPVEFIKQKQKTIKDQDIVNVKEEQKNNNIEVKKATKAQDDSQAVVNKLSKKWNVLLSDVASPWVRMAMPMATEEGGVFFRPNVGDEVIVNFDCGNIERPYVTGSLYSKEHIDPGGNMVIKSPSGQKMTFNVAKNDKDFVESLTPMLSKVGSYIPVLGNKLTFGKDARKLCGGITLNDEFGMFSVDMSSTKRAVSIKSPFGKVSVNAFTGISIEAPNGDISIKGKNVSIEAGNNLRLLSGANVTDANSGPEPEDGPAQGGGNSYSRKERKRTKVDRWIKAGTDFGFDWAMEKAEEKTREYLGKYTASFKIVDMQLLRCLSDVFLRPIEGTLQVKSKNYLMFVAGKGNAEVPIDQYSRDWQKQFDVEKDADKQRFYAKTTAYIKRIDQKIGQFCNDYKNLLEDAFKAQESYELYIKSVYKKDCLDHAPKCLADGFKNADKEFKKNDDDDFKGGTIDMSCIAYKDFKGQEKGRNYITGLDGEILTSVKEVKAYLKPAIEDYGKAAWAVHRQVLAFKTLFSDNTIKAINQATLGTTSHKDTQWIDEAFKKAIFDSNQSELEFFPKKWHDRYGTFESGPKDNFINHDTPDYEDVFYNPVIIKRKLVAKFLLELYKSEGNLIPPEIGVNSPKPGKFFKICYKEVNVDLVMDNWSDVAALGSKDNPGFFKKLLSFVANWTGAKNAWSPVLNPDKPKMGWERRVWNGKGGKIIFSDQANVTYHINGENIETWKHADLGNEANLKKAISNIK